MKNTPPSCQVTLLLGEDAAKIYLGQCADNLRVKQPRLRLRMSTQCLLSLLPRQRKNGHRKMQR